MKKAGVTNEDVLNAEFFEAIADIEREKGIPQNYMFEKIEQALLTALRKDVPDSAEAARVVVDPKKRTIEMYIEKTVADEVEDPTLEISTEEAKLVSPKYKAGDVVRTPVDAKKFGRIAAQAAKQVIIQGIREAERSMIYEEFTSKEHEVLTGVIAHIDERTGAVSINVSSNSEYTEAVLPASECIPGEKLREGGYIKVYVVEVKKAARGPQVMISRTHPGLVKRLFEIEVPEIADGTVEIRAVAREAGSRSKIAVWSNNPAVEPIGACVGPRGQRVAAIVDELGGEKIDVVNFSEDPRDFVSAALAPSDVSGVELLDAGGRSCRVIVPDSQLSLAIGKEGQNVRLAARLTGCKIDIKPLSQFST
ncbi:MAG: transcription termination factor NusA [Oscillospiraceae bacterium]|jgi:N utilization substance protein A|nr:transcription termination factor NusA [Oscillospiraceae bacterium]